MGAKISNQIFYFCMFLCIFASLEHVFSYGKEDNYLRRAQKHFIVQENHHTTNNSVFNVLNYGAKGDGITNDAQAFEEAWKATCQVEGGVMLVPSGTTFLLQPVNFYGNYCQPDVTVQVDGKIVAPPDISKWEKNEGQWILFKWAIKGLTIKGNGVIDGCGDSWWKDDGSDHDGPISRPHAIYIVESSNVTVKGITIQNSPRMHIFVESSQHVKIFNFTASSPGDSPNTDGIHLSHVQHAEIHDVNLSCGDDCVSIQNGCSNVEIYNVKCGPGHGFSIGGLGPPNNREAHVSDITVVNSIVRDALSGLRIKTWPGGRGLVNNVAFSNITMSEVKTPITIDQNYCDGLKNCTIPDTDAVAISNVSYKSIRGTYTYTSVAIVCSRYKACTNLTIADVNLTPSKSNAVTNTKEPDCFNAYGNVLTSTEPPLENCLLSGGVPTQAPTVEPQLQSDFPLSFFLLEV